MSNYSRKFKQPLFFSLYFLLLVCAMIPLVGCSGSDDIPPASILASGRVTLTWENVLGAAAYNIYFSTSPGVTVLNSFKFSNVTTPFTIADLEPGTTYYFVVTIEDALGQSRNSKELSYTALADAEGSLDFGEIEGQSALAAKVSESKDEPAVDTLASELAVTPEPKDKKVVSTHSNKDIIISTEKSHPITLSWDDVPNATSYNIYWSDVPGVTKKNGTKISNVKNPHKLTGLKKGKVYYFVVTAVNSSGESKESRELSFTVGQ